MAAKYTRASLRTNSRRLFVETLESRVLLSGNVTAAVSFGTLTLTGDIQDNSIVIDQAGLGTNQFRVSSGDGTTTINGAAGPLVFSGASVGITVNTGAGNDTVLIQNAAVSESIHVTGTSGNKNTTLLNLTVHGNVYIQTGGPGTHNFTMIGCALQKSIMASNNPAAGGSVFVTNGAGASNTILAQDSILYNLSVTNALGTDNFLLAGSSVGGGVTLANGAGDTTLAFTQDTITNLLSVTNGDGNNSFSCDFCTTGAIQIANGNGSASTEFYSTMIVGSLTVTNLTGEHAFAMDTCLVNFCGAFVQLTNGDGDSGISFDNSVITASLSVQNGNGDAGFRMDDTALGAVSIVNGNGDIGTDFGDSVIGGWLVIKNGQGSHALEIDSTQIYGYINLANANGDSAVNITNTTVQLSFTLNNNLGTDSLAFAGCTIGGNVTIADGTGNCFADIETTLIGGNLAVTDSGLADVVVTSSFVKNNATITVGAGSTIAITHAEVGNQLVT